MGGAGPGDQKALTRGDRHPARDRVEINEAFAAQALGVVRELGLDPATVNV